MSMIFDGNLDDDFYGDEDMVSTPTPVTEIRKQKLKNIQTIINKQTLCSKLLNKLKFWK